MSLKGLYLENLSWLEAETVLKPNPVVVIPIGARLKEHGPHLPLNNDWLMAEYLTRRALESCAAVALPTVAYGHYPAFLEYPGSISLSHDTFRDTITDICRSLGRHGAKRFYALNTGISTIKPLMAAQLALKGEGYEFAFTDLRKAASNEVAQVRTQTVGTHADEIETSMMLYLAPEVVRLDRAKPDQHEDHGPLTRDPGNKNGTYSATGTWGDPTSATVEKGRLVVEALVAHIVAEIEKLAH